MFRSLGKITVVTPGTKVRATVNEADPTKVLKCQGVMIDALGANTGVVYVGGPNLNRTTFADVYAIVVKGTTRLLEVKNGADGVDASAIYLDVDTGNDTALVALVEQ